MPRIVLVLALPDTFEGAVGGGSRDCRVEELLEVAEASFEGFAGFTELLVVAGGSGSSSSLAGALLTRPGCAINEFNDFTQKTWFF